MSGRRRLLGTLAVALLLWPRLGLGQAGPGLNVFDLANFGQNTISAVQGTITAIEEVFQSAQTVLELKPLGGIVVGGGVAEDMKLLGQIVDQAQGLSYDYALIQSQITSLFALSTAPATRSALTERLATIKNLKLKCYTYAAEVQALLRTSLRTVQHLQSLLDTVGKLVGNMQGNQTAVQAQAVMGKHLANLDAQLAAFHRAEVIDKLTEGVIIESVITIQTRRIADWPRW
jgi:conjugal transfer/entry exclusion protein